MEDIRRELGEAFERAARYRRTGELLRKARTDEAELEQRLRMLADELAKESSDVDKLETGSISGTFYRLFGKYDEHLEKERAEWLAAKLKFDESTRAQAVLQSRIAELEAERASLEGSEEKYAALYAQKTQLLLYNGGEAAQRITTLIEEIERAKAKLREIGEALSAGQYAAGRLQAAVEELEDAESWGRYDMFGGGMIASSIKHDHIDNAADAAHEAQLALDRFNAELADIQIAPMGDVSMSEGMRFADTFFDGLIVDWMAQRGIEESLEGVASTKADVEMALRRLKSMASEEEARQRALEDELHKRVMEG